MSSLQYVRSYAATVGHLSVKTDAPYPGNPREYGLSGKAMYFQKLKVPFEFRYNIKV